MAETYTPPVHNYPGTKVHEILEADSTTENVKDGKVLIVINRKEHLISIAELKKVLAA